MDGAAKTTEQRIWFAMMLSALGGIMDGYSYAVRGGVFATGQTGNLLIFGFGLLRRQPDQALRALVPIIGFWCGIFVAQFLLHCYIRQSGNGNRKGIVLFMESIALFVVGLVPDTVLDIVPNTMISLLAAMQFCSFREFGDKSSYASVFCTGNMRSCAECYYLGLAAKDSAALRRALQYTGILAAFLLGAMVSMALSARLGEKTIWAGAVIAFLGGVRLTRLS